MKRKMNKSDYISILKLSFQNQNFDAISLDKLADSYPYHAPSHILLAKSASNYGSMYATKKLKHASLFSPNRAYLRKLFSQTASLEQKNWASSNENTQAKDIFFQDLTIKSNNNNIKEDILATIDSTHIEIIAEEVKKTSTEPSFNISYKYYVHTSEFGNSPKVCKNDLLSEFLAFRGEIVLENPALDYQQNIIQKFIDEEPKISRFEPQAIESSKSDLSKRSTTENDALITENMANILVKQNKNKRAIEVFQKLILKYPEKETYFTEKIISLQFQI